jgi:hypothetical protein
MHEDRAILDTVFATNRNAIIDLHNLEQSAQATSKEAEKNHDQEYVSAPVAEIPPIPDVLPTATRISSASPKTAPRRSFSRRGMRLGVHMSILDMGAHSAPDALKRKWIQTSRSHHPVKPIMTGARSPEKAHVRFPLEASPTKANIPPEKKTLSAAGHGRKANGGWISAPTAEKLHKMIDHLELSHSTGISTLVPHGRRRSSVGKQANATATADSQATRRSSASKQDAPPAPGTGNPKEEWLKEKAAQHKGAQFCSGRETGSGYMNLRKQPINKCLKGNVFSNRLEESL